MKVKVFVNGELSENCYLIYNGKYGLIIDPGTTMKELERFIDENEIEVVRILVTHYHFDHIGALDYYKDKYNAQVIDYKSETVQKIKCFDFKVIKTFGHTMDSVTFYFEKHSIMFTGDFLFKETIGNYNSLNEGNMIDSLKMIKKYPKDVKVYPGHDTETTLDHEIKYNPYLRSI